MNRDILSRMRNMHKMSATPMSLLLGVDEFFRDFDEMISRASHTKSGGNFPPFNIKRKGEEYIIELALAGFSRDEISVSLNKNKNILTISGNATESLSDPELSEVFLEPERMKILSGISSDPGYKKNNTGYDDSGVKLSKVMGEESSSAGGFEKADIEQEEEKEEWLTLYKGISKRKFSQEFKLPRAAEIQSAKMDNGMLSISVTLPKLEEKETVSIEIN